MIIVNAEAVEATAATLSAAEALEILAPSANAITNEEAASLRQIVAAVATRDPATAQRLAAKKPPPPPPLPPQNGSAASDLKAFLETADLGRYADALVAAGCASVARLKAMPQEELKNLKDPRTGGRVLAVGALARLRRQLNASPAPEPPLEPAADPPDAGSGGSLCRAHRSRSFSKDEYEAAESALGHGYIHEQPHRLQPPPVLPAPQGLGGCRLRGRDQHVELGLERLADAQLRHVRDVALDHVQARRILPARVRRSQSSDQLTSVESTVVRDDGR